MKLTADNQERLLFIKYLLSQAEMQKDLDRPICSTAILTLHDLVECFLQLVYEQLAKKSKLSGNNILDIYSEEINKILQEQDKTNINKAYIRRLNELRNQLKHSTIFIDARNIENLYFETETFFEDFCILIFSISPDDISIAQLVSHEDIKSYLLEAEKQLIAGEFHTAMLNTGKAFYEYLQMATDLKDRRGYNLIKRYPSRVNYLLHYEATLGTKSLDGNLKRGLREIAKDINEIKQSVFDLTNGQLLHLDMRKFLLYKEIMPQVSKIQTHEGGQPTIKWHIPEEQRLTTATFRKEEVKFCFDFVIETIFNFQRMISS